MAADKLDEKEAWIGFARDATAIFPMPDEIDDADEQAVEVADFTINYADEMIDALRERFSKGGKGAKRRRKKDEEEEEEESD